MKTSKFTMFLLIACTLTFLLAGQNAFGAVKIVKFQVKGCD
jgi:hypothetical protein